MKRQVPRHNRRVSRVVCSCSTRLPSLAEPIQHRRHGMGARRPPADHNWTRGQVRQAHPLAANAIQSPWNKWRFGWGTWIRSKTKRRPKVAGNLDFTGGQHREWTMPVANRQERRQHLGVPCWGSVRPYRSVTRNGSDWLTAGAPMTETGGGGPASFRCLCWEGALPRSTILDSNPGRPLHPRGSVIECRSASLLPYASDDHGATIDNSYLVLLCGNPTERFRD